MARIGCFSSPQMPLLPTTITTGSFWRTSDSTSISEKPAAPSPISTQICRSGWVTRAPIA